MGSSAITGCNICIVGGGPAGLLVADELSRRGIDVVVLESGGASGSETADLGQGDVIGDPISALDLVATRHRRFGGNAHLWCAKLEPRSPGRTLGVRYGTMTRLAFDSRAWLPNPGWPIGYDELHRWYRRAHELLAAGPFDYDAAGESGASWLDQASFDPRGFRFGRGDRFLIDLLDRLKGSSHATLVEGATVTRLHQPQPGAPAASLSYRDEAGREHEMTFRAVVLATGAIENARLLLRSNSENGGIGNESDNVGRYFMDHPLFSIGDIHLDDPSLLDGLGFFDLRMQQGGLRHGHLVTNRAWCKANNAVEIGISLFPRPRRPFVRAVETARWLRDDPAHFVTHPPELGRALGALGRGIPYLPRAVQVALVRRQSLLPGFGRGGWSECPTGLGFRELEVVLQCEQAPEPNSRVTLADRRDRFGSPLPVVTWLLGDQTRRSVAALQGLVASSVERAGIGAYVPRAGDPETLETPASLAHHMGTTRMSNTPETGVVDPDCRLHTCPNVFVAGSSVFPTSGYVNPTLTIGALAMRLAGEIAKSRPPSVSRRPAEL